ncbi:unnamed protein product [Laminaria digitata]
MCDIVLFSGLAFLLVAAGWQPPSQFRLLKYEDEHVKLQHKTSLSPTGSPNARGPFSENE